MTGTKMLKRTLSALLIACLGVTLIGAAPSAWGVPPAWAAQVAWAAAEESGGAGEQVPAQTPNAQSKADATPANTVTMYTKRQVNLFKAKKTSSKILSKVPRGAAVDVATLGKSWATVEYDGKSGFIKSEHLSATEPTPSPEPTPIVTPEPTPVPRDRLISMPASAASTLYVGQKGSVSVTAPQIIAAFAIDYAGQGEGYFSRVNRLVGENIYDLLDGGAMPSGLSDYEAIISALISDMKGDITFELLGKQYGAKKNKLFTLFSKNASVIGVSTLTQPEGGPPTFEFGEYTMRAGATKGTYFLQMSLSLKNAPKTRALYPNADSLTVLTPIKAVKQSSGGGGGGGGSSVDKQLPVARLVVESIETEPAEPAAGEEFDIILSLHNTSESMFLRNMQLTYTADDDAIKPVSGINTVYIDRIDAGAYYDVRLNVYAKPDIENSNIKLDIAIDFEDKKLNQLTSTHALNLNIKQVQRMELDTPVLPTGEVVVGDNYEVEMNVFNLGKTMLYNVTARVVPENENEISPGKSYFIGNMDPGSSKATTLAMVPLTAGEHKVKLAVTYETVDGKATTATQDITFASTAVEEYDYSDPGYDDSGYESELPPPPPETMDILAALPWQFFAAAGALLTLVVVWIGVGARRRRLRAFEDDEMD